MTKPRVLVIGLNYAPERTGIAPYTTGMAGGLTADFDVDVLTVHPHYPEWKVADGYAGWRRRELIDGVNVSRVRHYVPTNPTGLSRVVSEASFAARVLAPGVRRPDVILAVTPALVPVVSALALGRRWRVPVGLVVQDLYSKAFAELRIAGGRLNGVAHRFERALLQRANGIVAIHDHMADVMSRDFGLDRTAITVIRNWAHVRPASSGRDARRRDLAWDDGRLTVVHAGNMGAKQGLEHVISAARLVDERHLPIRFVLIGNGGQREQLEEWGREVGSLEFLDVLPDELFMDTLSAADVLLMHERPGVREMCVPSKLTSYFAASRPVLAATDFGSAAARELAASDAGVVIAPGEPETMIAALMSLRASDLEPFGRRGLAYAGHTLDEGVAHARYVAWAQSLMS